MRKTIQCIACLTIAFVMLFLTGAYAQSIDTVQVTTAALSSSTPTMNGMVRVYLSSLGSPASLTLTVSGNYSLSNGTSLVTGETLRVSFNSATGAITMTRNGTAYSMGSMFTLRRHSATGSNGIKIAQARKPGNLYPGDIQLKAVAQSSGGYKLYTIAYIYIENYLYGVLPYEMGSSSSLEALKAQAVAARTYTVRMMNARTSWSYDVVDTTGDQTYNGTPTTVSSCNTAVDATKGIVLKYGTAYTATYYSASNGGQTESIYNAWGTSGYRYLGVKDDPFDYANPSSVVKKATVYADAASAYNNASLMSLLKTKAVAALTGTGYNATAYNTTLQTITAITANTPKYASPSKLYTKMDFTLRVGTYSASNVYTTVSITVTCSIFSELESLLGMGIQSSANELWSVVQTSTGFEIQARRYGHGIGMSQRGAMYMGQIGYTYDEILGFYYDDSVRVGCTFTNTILAAGSSEVIVSEEDPADTGGDSVRGVVTLAGGSSLAIRGAKSATAAVLTVLTNGTSVTVLADDGTWCLVTFGSITGYVPTNALSVTGTVPDESDTPVSTTDGFAVVTANGYLNLRSSASNTGSIVTTAPAGAIVTVLSWNITWAHIQYGTIDAYASAEYLSHSATYPEPLDESPPEQTPDDPAETPGDPTTPDAVYAVVATQSGSLNMRQFAQAGSAILTTIPKGTTVTVTSRGNTWSYVTYLTAEGYVMTMFLTFASDPADPQEEPTGNLQATVVTASGSLNLRALPQTGSAIYCTIPRLAVIDVSQKGAEWCQVLYSGITGYVMTVFLAFIESDDSPDDPGTGDDPGDDTPEEPVTAVVTTASGSLNLRAEAVPTSSVLTRIPKGETIAVLQRLASWTYTCYENQYGYVMNDYLTFSGASGGETSANPVRATVNTESGSLNLRDEPYGDVLAQIPQHAVVDVYNKGSAWCYLRYNGLYGYVMTAYLNFPAEDDTSGGETENPDSGTGETETPGPGPTDPPSQATEATITVESDSLNLRVSKLITADILTTIPNGTIVPLLLQGADWCKISYSGYQGYVQTQYLTFGSGAGESSDSDTPEGTLDDTPDDTGEGGTGDAGSGTSAQKAWVNTVSGSLNLRETAASDANVIVRIPQYAEVEVLTDIGAAWCKVNYANILGHVQSAYLTTTRPQPDTGEKPQEEQPGGTEDHSDEEDTGSQNQLPMDSTLHTPGTAITVYVRPPAGSSGVRVYEGCSESCDLIVTMAEGDSVEIIRAGTTWCEVLYGEQQGYCLRDGLSFFDE